MFKRKDVELNIVHNQHTWQAITIFFHFWRNKVLHKLWVGWQFWNLFFVLLKFRLLVFTKLIFWEMRSWIRMFDWRNWKIITFFSNFLWSFIWVTRLDYFIYLWTPNSFFGSLIRWFFFDLHKIINSVISLIFYFQTVYFSTFHFFTYCS